MWLEASGSLSTAVILWGCDGGCDEMEERKKEGRREGEREGRRVQSMSVSVQAIE